MCSGKVFVDLIDSKFRQQNEETAIIRVEQLYPFPEAELKALVKTYANVEEIVWVQEEPENMGAGSFTMPILTSLFGSKLSIKCVGRPANASPAEGSTPLHIMHQSEVVEKAFKGDASKRLNGEGQTAAETQSIVETQSLTSLQRMKS